MIKLVNVSKFYHNEGNVVLGLHRANLEFKMGEFIAITGESGSGKSTLLNVISGMDSYEEGEMYFNGEETSHYDESDWQEYRKNNISFVFQNYHLIDSYTVLENVEAVMIINGIPKKERRQRAIEILTKVGLDKHLKHRGTKLSGGEKQRLAIARAIAKDTPVIVADEPTGNLDSQTGLQIMEILKELSKTKLVIMVTHNYELLDDFVSRVVRLYDGKVVENKVLYEVKIDNVIENKHLAIPAVKKSLPLAFWNFKNQPKVTIFSLIVTLITTFLVSFMFANLLDTRLQNSYNYNNSFPGSLPTRIIVAKDDVITNDELNQIKKIGNVDYVIQADLIYNTDMFYEVPDGNRYYHANYRSLKELSDSDLIEGRMPSNDFEVVIEDNDNLDLLNKNIIVHTSNYIRYGYLGKTEYTVVGIAKKSNDTRYTSNIYFTENGLIFLNKLYYTEINKYVININEKILSYQYLIFDVDNSLSNGTVDISYYHMEGNSNIPDYQAGDEVRLNTQNLQYDYVINEYEYIGDSDYYELVMFKMNSHDFNNLTINSERQISLYVKNLSLINQTISRLENLGYYAFNPSSFTYQDDLLTNVLNLIFTIFFLGIIFAIYMISSVIINAIFKMKLKDNIILRSMGLDSYSSNLVTIIQVTAYFIFSILLLYPIIIFLSSNNPTFQEIYRSFHWYHYILLFLINVGLGIYVAIRVNNSVRKKTILSAMLNE